MRESVHQASSKTIKWEEVSVSSHISNTTFGYQITAFVELYEVCHELSVLEYKEIKSTRDIIFGAQLKIGRSLTSGTTDRREVDLARLCYVLLLAVPPPVLS